MWTLIATLATIGLYGAASQVGGVAPRYRPRVKYKGSNLLQHNEFMESTHDWIWGSSVCTLGKIAWVLWSVVLLLLLAVPTRSLALRYLLWSLLFVTVLLSALMNPPLAVRAFPAFVLMLLIIPYLT